MCYLLRLWSKYRDKKYILILLGAYILVCPGLVSAGPNIRLVPIVSGINSPVAITHAGEGSGRLFITLKVGEVLIYDGY